MGKKPKPEPQPVAIVSTKEHGLKLDFSEITREYLVGVLAVILFLGWVVWREFGDHTPQYRPAPEPWAGWRIILGILLAAFVVAVVLGVVYAAFRLYLSVRRSRAEVIQAETNARTVHAAENGLYPLVERAGRLVNPNAAPAGVVESDGQMPDPATPAQYHAAERAAVVQVAAAGHGGRALSGLMGAPRLPLGGDDLPPVRVIEGDLASHVERLLKAGAGEEA